MTVWKIKHIPIFANLNPLQINSIIRNARKVRCRRGTLICKSGLKSKNLFIILKGQVLVKSDKGETLRVLRELDIFNEIGFVYALPRKTSCIAAEETVLVILDKSFIEILSLTDSTVKKILKRNILINLEKKVTLH